MQIIERRLEELRPYEHNTRKNDEAVEKVAESIKQFGFNVPIMVDHENVIIAGHTRLKAAEALGLKKVPVLVVDDLDALLEEMKEIGADDWKDFGFNEKDMKGLRAPDECTCPKCGKVFIDT